MGAEAGSRYGTEGETVGSDLEERKEVCFRDRGNRQTIDDGDDDADDDDDLGQLAVPGYLGFHSCFDIL